MIARTFTIRWSIREASWNEAKHLFAKEGPGTLRDRNGMILLDLLGGRVQLFGDDKPLIPPEWLEANWRQHYEDCIEAGIAIEPVLPPGEFEGESASMAQFACYLADLLVGRVPLDSHTGQPQRYRDLEGSPIISFQYDEDTITVRSNWTLDYDDIPDYYLAVEPAAFEAGVQGFLTDVATKIGTRAPDLLAWQTLEPLRSYVPSQ